MKHTSLQLSNLTQRSEPLSSGTRSRAGCPLPLSIITLPCRRGRSPAITGRVVGPTHWHIWFLAGRSLATTLIVVIIFRRPLLCRRRLLLAVLWTHRTSQTRDAVNRPPFDTPHVCRSLHYFCATSNDDWRVRVVGIAWGLRTQAVWSVSVLLRAIDPGIVLCCLGPMDPAHPLRAVSFDHIVRAVVYYVFTWRFSCGQIPEATPHRVAAPEVWSAPGRWWRGVLSSHPGERSWLLIRGYRLVHRSP